MNRSSAQAAALEISIREIRTRLFWTRPLIEVQELFYEISKLKNKQ
jgi:hypothetical protein